MRVRERVFAESKVNKYINEETFLYITLNSNPQYPYNTQEAMLHMVVRV